MVHSGKKVLVFLPEVEVRALADGNAAWLEDLTRSSHNVSVVKDPVCLEKSRVRLYTTRSSLEHGEKVTLVGLFGAADTVDKLAAEAGTGDIVSGTVTVRKSPTQQGIRKLFGQFLKRGPVTYDVRKSILQADRQGVRVDAVESVDLDALPATLHSILAGS